MRKAKNAVFFVLISFILSYFIMNTPASKLIFRVVSSLAQFNPGLFLISRLDVIAMRYFLFRLTAQYLYFG
ncbi:hypothetical protein AMJ80_11145 [bacterium SM23_31]|nr:MAG: hypothetical protein AMJ80_11145 [bacterium SM23_31]